MTADKLPSYIYYDDEYWKVNYARHIRDINLVVMWILLFVSSVFLLSSYVLKRFKGKKVNDEEVTT